MPFPRHVICNQAWGVPNGAESAETRGKILILNGLRLWFFFACRDEGCMVTPRLVSRREQVRTLGESAHRSSPGAEGVVLIDGDCGNGPYL